MSSHDAGFTVTRRPDAPIALFTIDRPARANALNHDIVDALIATVRDLPYESQALLIGGSATVFSAGADLGCVSGDCGDNRSIQGRFDALIDAIETAPFPVAVLLDGPCVGAAVEMSLSCDARLSTPRGSLRIPATEIGTVYRPEGVENLVRRLPPLALQSMLLMGNRIPTSLAAAWGLVEQFDDVDAAVVAFADKLTRLTRKPGVFAAQKASLRAATHAQRLPEQTRLTIAGIRQACADRDNQPVRCSS